MPASAIMDLRWRLSHAQGYLQLGMLKQAAAELDAIGPPDSSRLDVLALRVALLHERQDWRALRRVAGQLVRRQPEEVGWWISHAFATRRVVSVAAARAILLDAERHHPDEAIVQFNLGCYACQLGETGEARRRVARAIALDKTFAEHAQHDPDLEPLRQTEAGTGTGEAGG